MKQSKDKLGKNHYKVIKVDSGIELRYYPKNKIIKHTAVYTNPAGIHISRSYSWPEREKETIEHIKNILQDITISKLKGKTRKLTAKWSVSSAETLNGMYGL